MYKVLINKENEVMQFISTDYSAVDITARAKKPADERGVDWVEKVKKDNDKWVTYWAKVERPLTKEEEILKRLEENEQNTVNTMKALVEIASGKEEGDE